MKSLAYVLVCFLCAAPSMANAQGVGSSGEITGTLADASGAVLPKATVNVVDTQTGLKRTVVSDGARQFPMAGLSPAPYDGTAALAVGARLILKGVTPA